MQYSGLLDLGSCTPRTMCGRLKRGYDKNVGQFENRISAVNHERIGDEGRVQALHEIPDVAQTISRAEGATSRGRITPLTVEVSLAANCSTNQRDCSV